MPSGHGVAQCGSTKPRCGRRFGRPRRRHNFDKIRLEYFGDYDAAFEAFKAGVYTFRNEVSSIHWATRYDFPALKAGTVKQELLPRGGVASGQSWVFNLRRAKFQDIRLREAIGRMFNFEWSKRDAVLQPETRASTRSGTIAS